jgi:hypothetical protein
MGKENRRTVGTKPRIVLPGDELDDISVNSLMTRTQNCLLGARRHDDWATLRARWRALRGAERMEKYRLLCEYVEMWPTPNWANEVGASDG